MHLAHFPRVFLDHLHEATTARDAGGMDMRAEMNAAVDKLHAKHRQAYVIPSGGSHATDALGYDAAFRGYNKWLQSIQMARAPFTGSLTPQTARYSA